MTVDGARAGCRRSVIVRSILVLVLLVVAVTAVLVLLLWREINRADGFIVSSGEKRSYLLHVPAGYSPATPAPLVISIHGFASWPGNQMEISRWNDLADQKGFLVVYPGGAGMPKRWRAGILGQAGDDMQRDVTFIADLIDALEERFNIDRSRVYVNGLSNGGGMTYLLACRLADRIAAAGGVAGAYLLPLSDCRPQRAVPLIAFHGTADPIVPYNGGPSAMFSIPFPSVPDWVSGWAALSGCSANPQPVAAQGAVSGIRYSGCKNDAEVVFYTIEGGGHTWPGGQPLPARIAGETTRDIDATAVMWEFFMRHPLPAR